MSSRTKLSLTHVVLALIPVLACLGAMVSLSGSPLFGFRIAAALLLILAILQQTKLSISSGLRSLAVILCYAWVVVAVTLMLVHGINDDAWSELASLTAGVALLVAISTLRDVTGNVSAIIRGWLIAYFVTAYFGARELIFGETLPSYYQSDHIDPIGAGFGIASTFGNPNAYAFFLVASIPIFALGLSRSRSWWVRIAFMVALLTLPILLNGTDSRTGVALAVVIGMVLVIYLFRIRSVTLLSFSSIAAVAASTVLLVAMLVGIRDHDGILQRLDSTLMHILSEDSVVARWMLVRNGIDLTVDSAMMGMGPGGFEYYMATGEQRFHTMGNTNPHNGFIEIISQYGLLVFLLFTFVLIRIAVHGWRAAKIRLDGSSMTEGYAAVVLIVALPFLATMNSSFLEPSETWLLLGTILALGMSVEKQKSSSSAEKCRVYVANRWSTLPLFLRG